MLILFLFLVLILSILFTIKPTKRTNFKKSYRISENRKNDQTYINLTKFDFIGKFSNYVGFGESKWLCVFTKYTTQRNTKKYNKTKRIDINSI